MNAKQRLAQKRAELAQRRKARPRPSLPRVTRPAVKLPVPPTVDRARLEQRARAQSQAVAARRAELERRRTPRLARSEAPRRTSRWWIAAVALLIALLFFRTCEEPEPEPDIAETPVAGPPVRVAVPAPKPTPEPMVAPPRVARRERPDLVAPPPKTPGWLTGFRMQVSARSPRLAKCFEGATQPGQLKWTASVEPSTGRVGDQVIEPLLLTGELPPRERRCVQGVLSSPPYRLPMPEEGAEATSRVSLVLEF